MSASELIAMVEKMTVEERARLRALLMVEPATEGGGGGVAAAPRPKKGAAVVWGPLPEPEDGEEPDASAYRISAPVAGVCDGRRFNEKDPLAIDRRWKPAVYRELQCGGAIKDDGLCATCLRRREKYAAEPSPKIGWLGRISDEPLEWCHMLGTAWAEERKPIFGAGSASASASEVSAASAASKAEAAAAEKARKAEEKAAAKAEKAAAAEKAKAERAAEREAKKEANRAAHAAAQAEKEAARLAAKAEKEAAKAAAAAEKAAKKSVAKKAAGGEAKEKEE